MRRATQEDIEYLTSGLIGIAKLAKRAGKNAHSAGLPSEPDAATRRMAASFVESDKAIALIAEDGGKPLGCLMGRIGQTSMPASGLGVTGHIEACWVEPEYRGREIGSRMVEEAERWFKSRGVHVVELSYLVGNETAAEAWNRMGYTPFRIFSSKEMP